MTTTLPPDPWKALGVDRDADKAEVRTAYKKLVLRCHPDKVQDPTLRAQKADQFQKVQQAYELLNDDAEKAKYEQKLRLAELQRAAKVSRQDVKISPNSSVPRTSAKYATYDIRTAEPASRYKSSPSGGKVYYTTAHTRSHEEVPSSRAYAQYEEPDRQARRTASYEKPSKRDDERRERERDKEERRRKKELEELRLREKDRDSEKERDRQRERERAEKEREARKAEKKQREREREKEREKERKRDAEEKARRYATPYVENYDPYEAAYVEDVLLDDEKFVTSRSEKKRSSSRKHDDTRERERERDRDRDRDRDRGEREKSSSRRAKSPHVSSDRKHVDLYEQATNYLARNGNSLPSQKGPGFWKSETPPEPSYIAPLAPTPPPPVDFEEDSLRHAAARAAGRRASNDPARSREKLKYDGIDANSKARPIPTLTKSYTSPPPVVPETPSPRVARSQTTPHESYRPVPSLGRTQTWAPSSNTVPNDYFEDPGSDLDDRERRRHRSRRTRSPSAQATRYKVVDGTKTAKLESHYSYGESPSSTRRYAADPLDAHAAHSPSATYPGLPFPVKQTKSYGLDDIKYSQYNSPSYYSSDPYKLAT
ncbi:hypothetical protein C8A00DRAFT_11643 [Chaetomidium leptoderma]|uniref:J domain-containing protein n=1 Tax=Chaetomidium leptoderma TaxID=669021 RepID=A0AAN6VUF1_9PEZI|nr:hypothetical protein C8A00DRAFT_11643 [Chaetomidium leptoderma]